MSTAHFTASTTLENSTRNPSPIVLKIRPPYFDVFGSIISLMIFEPTQCSFLVITHKARVSDNVCGNDCCQLSPHRAFRRHARPRTFNCDATDVENKPK